VYKVEKKYDQHHTDTFIRRNRKRLFFVVSYDGSAKAAKLGTSGFGLLDRAACFGSCGTSVTVAAVCIGLSVDAVPMPDVVCEEVVGFTMDWGGIVSSGLEILTGDLFGRV